MAEVDKEFNKLSKLILDTGLEYENKNRGVKRLQIPSYTFRHEFKNGFPAITNKQLYFKGIIGELIWFLRGDNDVEYLNKQGITIWNKDAYNWYTRDCKKKGTEPMSKKEFDVIGKGSVGQNYSVQWRNFNGITDQIQILVDTMKTDIMSSRLKVNAWNPSEVDLTALPPCHSEFQVIGVPLADGKFGFELHWNQRSVDTFLGAPFNIASYGALAKIIEGLTGYKALAIEGTLKCVHFYDNQYEVAKELVSRDPDTHPNCELEINFPKFDNPDDVSLDDTLDRLKIEDFKLVGYSSDKPIKVEMLAPKE